MILLHVHDALEAKNKAKNIFFESALREFFHVIEMLKGKLKGSRQLRANKIRSKFVFTLLQTSDW